MIKWRLGEVMARYRIKGIELAQVMEISNNAVSNYRKATTMPQINGERFNALLNALNRLKPADEPTIGIADLIEYYPDHEPESD